MIEQVIITVQRIFGETPNHRDKSLNDICKPFYICNVIVLFIFNNKKNLGRDHEKCSGRREAMYSNHNLNSTF